MDQLMNKNSGSVSVENANTTVLVDDPNDLLRLCPGGCRKMVLFFGDDDIVSGSVDWSEQISNMMCLDCRANLLKEL